MSEFQLHCGDALSVLKTLPSESVDCCVTSPPYFGLRDYGTGQWEGGDTECEHKVRENPRVQSSGLDGGKVTVGHSEEGFRELCPRCGARRIDNQIGLERTPDEYVAKLVEVFREVRRVMKPQACLWLNLGDTYASNWPCNRRNIVGAGSLENGKRENRPPRMGIGLKDKDLIGIPWMSAFALRSDGWWLRSEVIWHKPVPLPESVEDRPTKAHEQIFLLSKRQDYFYDFEAIREPAVKGAGGSYFHSGKTAIHQLGRSSAKERDEDGKRNKRSVWSVAPEPSPDPHYAQMPTKLVEPCILAGCPEAGTVLDPFCGSGTVGAVALLHKRNFIGIDLNPDYIQMARRRLYQASSPLLGDVEVSVAG